MEKKELIEYLKSKSLFLQKEICVLANEEQIDHIHLGGLLSAVDILTALYYRYLDFKLDDLNNARRNKFIPSKAHCAVLMYLIFADLGLYKKEYIFERYKKFGHPFYQVPNKLVKGVEVSTGSLGVGLSIAVGMALSNRADGILSRIFCLTGDGEMQEGSNWEAIMFAGSHHLSNIVCIVDNNHCTASFRQGDNIVADWESAFEAFGWEVRSIDGANMEEIVQTFESLEQVDFSVKRKPIAIISNTRKGRNIDFIHGPGWHYGHLSSKSVKKALCCIEEKHQL